MGLAATIAARLSDLVLVRTRRLDRMDVASRRDPGMDHFASGPNASVHDQRLATVQAIRRVVDAGAATTHARDRGERVDMNHRLDLGLFVAATPLFADAAPPRPVPWPEPGARRNDDRLEGPAQFDVHYETASAIPLAAIDLLDHEVFNAVIARGLQSVRNADGSVRVVLHLANCRDEMLSLRLRLRLLRRDGTRIDPPSPWCRLTLDPHSLTTCRENSIDVRDASHYMIEIDRDRRDESLVA